VWVWGFWFGFALRRVALLCGVFVQLHLALFPAGEPFLPSLSVNIFTERDGRKCPPAENKASMEQVYVFSEKDEGHLTAWVLKGEELRPTQTNESHTSQASKQTYWVTERVKGHA
jgi:hypothetical protein